MPTREIAQQEVMDTFGACENINGCPGLHTNDSFDFTYRCVPIGMCYYDWYDNRTWYHFYFETKAEADKLIAEARNEQAEILREAAKMRNELIEKAHGEAADEAKKVTEAAQVSLEQARKEAEKTLRKEVGDLALQIAEKVIRKNIASDDAQRALVDQYLSEVETKN